MAQAATEKDRLHLHADLYATLDCCLHVTGSWMLVDDPVLRWTEVDRVHICTDPTCNPRLLPACDRILDAR